MYQSTNCIIHIWMKISVILALVLELSDSLIITSVIAGNKKFKTVSFDSKFLKPLTFETDLPNTEFRRHRVVRPPKFDIDVNIPIKLPLEDEYPEQEYKKPVVNDFFFQTGEIQEPGYGKKHPNGHKDEQYASSSEEQPSSPQASPSTLMRDGLKGLLPTLAKSIKFTPKIEVASAIQKPNSRSDTPVVNLANQQYQQQLQSHQQLQSEMPIQQQFVKQGDALVQSSSNAEPQYAPQQQHYKSGSYDQQEFVPGGFINLQLSGPTGGPKMTYEDYDKERWAQQLSQTEGAMPYPYLNYQQLQNFYGGLGTFTNGLAEHRYVEHSLLDKFKLSLNHVASKFHLG